MPDRKDAAVQPHQPARGDPVPDRTWVQAQCDELHVCDHAVLPPGDLCDPQVHTDVATE